MYRYLRPVKFYGTTYKRIYIAILITLLCHTLPEPP